MKARPNPISKIESFMQFLFEDFWERFFPSPLEPAELEQKLERFMESQRSLLGDGRFSVPYIYDIYLNIKDHQQLMSNQATLIKGWQTRLIDYAKHRQYVMREVPVLRLHGDSSLGVGKVRFEVVIEDGQNGEGGNTQQLDPSQLAALMARYPTPQSGSAPAPSTPTAASTNQSYTMPPTAANTGNLGASTPPMPPARLLIRLPHTNPQTYIIAKPVIGIGRQLDNDIIVEDKRVSRYHAQIKYQSDGQFALFDLGSTNGITINSVPNMRHHVLRNGDHFTIGSYDFQFERK